MTDRAEQRIPAERALPRLLQVREGTDLIIRGDGHLQFGAVPRHALVLILPPRVDVVQVHQVMRELRRPMADAGVVRLLGHCGVPEVHARGMLDELLHAGVLRARPIGHTTRVHVLGPSLYARTMLRHLRRLDIPTSGISPGTPAFGRLSGEDLVVMAGMLFPPADVGYRLMDLGVPHLTCGVVDTRVAVGPMLVPGRTACLSCLDAVSLADDARWRSVRAQAADGRVPMVDQLVESAASITAGLVREVLDRRAVSGDAGTWVVPEALSGRRYLDPLTLEISVTEVPTHPGCAVAPATATTGAVATEIRRRW